MNGLPSENNASPAEDYYEYLQVSPNADQETIERVYRLLAKKYHPDNNTTGSVDKFNLLTAAYKTLTDPEKRAAYDVHYEQARHREWRSVAGTDSSGRQGNDDRIRRTILSVLYIHRRDTPDDPGVGDWELEKVVGLPEKLIAFHIWYLKEKQWIARCDTGGYAITAAGVDAIEEDGIVLGKDLLLTDAPVDHTKPLIEAETPSNVKAFEKAIASLEAKTVLNPESIAAWVGLTYFNNKLGREDAAVAAARNILGIAPHFSAEDFDRVLSLKFRVDGLKNATLLKKAGLH